MEQVRSGVLVLLRSALFGDEVRLDTHVDWNLVYDEMCQQSVSELADVELMKVCPDAAIRRQWKINILRQIGHNETILYEQKELLCLLKSESIPAVILKGAAASQYYPKSENRAMGDVDFLVPQECFEKARALLYNHGFIQTKPEKPGDCLISLEKNGVEFEMHRYLRYDASKQLAEQLNQYIKEGMEHLEFRMIGDYSVPVLPDFQNGLVLLWHMRRHMDTGLGLRQILDWMMYMDRVLDDSFWDHGFQQAAKACGLEQLAKTVGRMCQLYLGLTETNRSWCMDVDEKICEELFQYIFDGGTFGCKLDKTSRSAVTHMIRNRGFLNRWKRLSWKNICRWLRKGFSRKQPMKAIFMDWRKSRRLHKMLKDLKISPPE